MKHSDVIEKMTLEEKAGLCSGLDFWHFKGIERLGIPSLMVCDGPHGLRKQDDNARADMLGVNESITAICFPTASALASSFDRNLLTEVGETLGEECQAADIAMLLGPGNNIKRSPLCGRNFEYFSEDPYLSSEMAAAHIKGVQSQGIGTSMKHYCANNQETRRMTASSNMDKRTLHEIYLAAFEGAVKKAKPTSLMCSYNRINGTFAAENKELLRDVLRDKWGFEGIVITDWGAVKDRVKGIEAGLHIAMPGGEPAMDTQIVEAVKRGTLEEARLDKIVEEILDFIFWVKEHKKEGAVFDYEGDHAKAGKAAEECAVLLKNEDHALPLKEGKKYAFIGEFAERPRYQGSGSSHIKAWKVENVLDAAKNLADITYVQGYAAKESETDEKLLNEAVEVAKNADAAVIFAGLPDSFESEGFDRKHLQMPKNQNALIREVARVQRNVIVVLNNGAPVEMPWIDDVKAVLEMYLAGEGVGTAEANLLFGKESPSGKLAETFPLQLSDNPSYLNFGRRSNEVTYQEEIYVGYRYYDKKNMEVLFPFGHGLSYSEFSYSNLQVSAKECEDREELVVSCTVKNTGSCKAKEVVQLYTGPVDESQCRVAMAVRALHGFEKIELMPGEEKQVQFVLDKMAFAYYDTALDDWRVESGAYQISIGASSRDIRLTERITVKGTVDIPVQFDRYSVMEDIMGSTKGQQIFAQMMQAGIRGEVPASDAGSMGDGGQEMMQAMAREMPLSSLISFGVMTEEQLEQILIALNS